MGYYRRAMAFVAIIAMGAMTGFVRAQETARPADERVKERLAYIESALDAARPRARTWWYGWISAYAAGTVAQWSLSAAHWNDTKLENDSPGARRIRDREFAQDMLVGGGTTALGLAGLLVDPFTPASGSKAFRRMPGSTADERWAKLLKAEEALRKCAAREKRGRGLTTHLLNIGVNAAAGIVTAAAFHRPWTDGLVTFAVGETVSLLNIFSQPRRAIRDLAGYEAIVRGGSGAVAAAPTGKDFYFGLSARGLSLGVRF